MTRRKILIMTITSWETSGRFSSGINRSFLHSNRIDAVSLEVENRRYVLGNRRRISKNRDPSPCFERLIDQTDTLESYSESAWEAL